ncbi:NADP-dependent oxidoreductase [Rhodosalinus sp. 5P4]|uniref:NADP-dependent oxidoreductase n=1 Tax=Rhodosalinus sp. 5P4 TaxID=3239196 RepID=UPI0035258929
MPEEMRRIVLASRPEAEAVPDNFRLEEADLPRPAEGEVLVRVMYLSLDPYMRGRMSAAKSYAPPVEIGGTMTGQGVGEVIESRSPRFAPGDRVLGITGWADHACLPAEALRKLDGTLAPELFLGVLGMPGFTGWVGLSEFGRPRQGETLAVAAATGPVGSMVGQLAKLKGLRAVGVAGGPEKCRIARETFGFDACIDHRAFKEAGALSAAIAEAAPDGIDIYFENVGGMVLDAVLPLLNDHARVPLCGTVAWYSGGAGGAQDRLPMLWRSILVRRLSVHGFIIFDHYDRYDAFLEEVAPMVEAGRIAHLEDVADGLESAPGAFVAMLKGGNTGKQLVRVG